MTVHTVLHITTIKAFNVGTTCTTVAGIINYGPGIQIWPWLSFLQGNDLNNQCY